MAKELTQLTYDDLVTVIKDIDHDAGVWLDTEGRHLDYVDTSQTYPRLSDILSIVFSWGRSPQGGDYWYSLCRKLESIEEQLLDKGLL